MWKLRITIFALVAFTAVTLVRADPLEDAMRWVADNSRFEYSHQTPKIVPMPKEEWDENGWFMHWAVYDKGFIYIPDFEEVPRGTWVHEVVHHYQWLAGEMGGEPCAGEHEPEAYAIEEKWLVENGYDPPKVDKFWLISMQAACRNPHQ